jgi:hypothetical protein
MKWHAMKKKQKKRTALYIKEYKIKYLIFMLLKEQMAFL